MKKSILFFIILIIGCMLNAQSQEVIYVSPTGTGDGKSWENAAEFSAAALSAQSTENCQMWLKEGTYSFAEPVNFDGLFIYGGFSGNETELSARNWHTHPAILDGNNQVSVLRNRTTTTGDPVPTLLDGVTVQNGMSPSDANGGGILSNNGTVLRNCIFRNNEAASSRNGAAVHCHIGTTTIENCLFVNNTSGGNGGAIQVGGGAKAILINCTMANNKAAGMGGAIGTGAANSNCTFINTVAWNNSSSLGFNSYAQNSDINGGGTIISIHSAIESASTKFTDGDHENHTVLSQENVPGFAAASTIIGKATNTSDEATAAAASYALAKGSVCIDAGKSGEAPHLLLDLAGAARVQGDGIDIGAYEFNAPPSGFAPAPLVQKMSVSVDGSDLYISGVEAGEMLRVFDAKGVLLHAQKVVSGDEYIRIRLAQPGVCFVCAGDETVKIAGR
ncbi:MAG: right-handed parallel beta-helix repeat-containing protein [Tannerella sp.]|jgi:predicted outer membrane repeat protein|nr:right-handed parallel beta-helix repeat-containing protein [Tannerella sp.]